MLNLDISCLEKCVDPDQLASEKPADQDPHCFQSACRRMLITIILEVDQIKMGVGE